MAVAGEELTEHLDILAACRGVDGAAGSLDRFCERLGGARTRAMRQQIANAVDLIVQATRLQGGPRKVTHITEVIGMEQDTIVMQDIFKYNQDGVDERGRAVGHFLATGIRPTFMSRLESSGVRLPSSAFRERIMLKD